MLLPPPPQVVYILGSVGTIEVNNVLYKHVCSTKWTELKNTIQPYQILKLATIDLQRFRK